MVDDMFSEKSVTLSSRRTIFLSRLRIRDVEENETGHVIVGRRQERKGTRHERIPGVGVDAFMMRERCDARCPTRE